jgi:hypothetical protein
MYGKRLPIIDARASVPGASSGTTERTKPATFEFLTTRKDELVGWARKFSLFPYPFVTACCAMEFMAVSASAYDTDRFGAALPRFSPRQADLLMVVGTVTQKQAPILLKVYVRAQVGDGLRRLREHGRFLSELRLAAGDRPDHSGGHLCPWLPTQAGNGDRRHHASPGKDRRWKASHYQRPVLT